MDLIPYGLKWLEFILRWMHVIFAILWVGNSFLFVYLDNKLNQNTVTSDDNSVDKEGYLMHSGYFYKLSRLKTSPPTEYLKSLVIFKWQSYLTFVTGVLLLCVTYYYNAGILMVNKKVLDIAPHTAIIISVAFLFLYWIVYDLLCKSSIINNTKLFLSIAFLLLIATSYGLTQIFNARFAFLSVGLILGTNMFGNVFTIIIPNQNKIIESSLNNQKFDDSLSLAAKQRSIHNNYSTYVVLFIMLSGHAGLIVYNKYNWLILCAIAIILIFARHYFNLRGRNTNNIFVLLGSIFATLLLASIIYILK